MQMAEWVTDGSPKASADGKRGMFESFNFPPGAANNVDLITVGTMTPAPTTTAEPTSST